MYDALTQLGDRQEKGIDPTALEAALSGLALLPANVIARASEEIADAALLLRSHSSTKLLWHLLKPNRSEFALLAGTQGLAWLFLFHMDGRVREAALHAIQEPPDSEFFVAAILWRLNDWAEPVREAAVACAQRTFPRIAAKVAANTELVLLSRQSFWGRWRDVERASVDALFERPDVIAEFAKGLTRGATGPLATRLRHALRYPLIDVHLLDLAEHAVQPAVRATALECLITKKASWPAGFGWEWVDKIYNQRHRVPLFESRPVLVSRPLDHLVKSGLADKSVFARRVAMDALIANRHSLPDVREMLALISGDDAPSIRERVDYLRRHLDS